MYLASSRLRPIFWALTCTSIAVPHNIITGRGKTNCPYNCRCAKHCFPAADTTSSHMHVSKTQEATQQLEARKKRHASASRHAHLRPPMQPLHGMHRGQASPKIEQCQKQRPAYSKCMQLASSRISQVARTSIASTKGLVGLS